MQLEESCRTLELVVRGTPSFYTLARTPGSLLAHSRVSPCCSACQFPDLPLQELHSRALLPSRSCSQSCPCMSVCRQTGPGPPCPGSPHGRGDRGGGNNAGQGGGARPAAQLLPPPAALAGLRLLPGHGVRGTTPGLPAAPWGGAGRRLQNRSIFFQEFKQLALLGARVTPKKPAHCWKTLNGDLSYRPGLLSMLDSI